LLNRTPRVTFVHTHGRIRNERHGGRKCTLKAGKKIKGEGEITEVVKRMRGDYRRGNENSRMVVIEIKNVHLI